MEHLIAIIIAWLSINYDLGNVNEQPDVAFVPSSDITQLWTSRIAANSPAGGRTITGPVHYSTVDPRVLARNQEVLAFYDEPGGKIYLTDGWRAGSPAHTSILVHELVHHLQHLKGEEYACPAAREKLAYQAQADWLSVFNKTLESEFGIDGLTLLVRTNCLM